MRPYGLTKKKTRYVSSWCACGVCGVRGPDWHPPNERKANKTKNILETMKEEWGSYDTRECSDFNGK